MAWTDLDGPGVGEPPVCRLLRGSGCWVGGVGQQRSGIVVVFARARSMARAQVRRRVGVDVGVVWSARAVLGW